MRSFRVIVRNFVIALLAVQTFAYAGGGSSDDEGSPSAPGPVTSTSSSPTERLGFLDRAKAAVREKLDERGREKEAKKQQEHLGRHRSATVAVAESQRRETYAVEKTFAEGFVEFFNAFVFSEDESDPDNPLNRVEDLEWIIDHLRRVNPFDGSVQRLLDADSLITRDKIAQNFIRFAKFGIRHESDGENPDKQIQSCYIFRALALVPKGSTYFAEALLLRAERRHRTLVKEERTLPEIADRLKDLRERSIAAIQERLETGCYEPLSSDYWEALEMKHGSLFSNIDTQLQDYHASKSREMVEKARPLTDDWSMIRSSGDSSEQLSQ